MITQQSPSPKPTTEVKIGVIPTLLLKDQVLTHEQLAYAVRVHSKLTTPQTMLDSLLELGLITQDQLQTTLRKYQLNVRLGDLLVELGYLRDSDLTQALAIQKESDGQRRLGEVLVDNGFIEERKLLESLSYQLGYQLIDPDFVRIDRSLLGRLPLDVCKQFNVLPLYKKGDQLVVTFADPLDQRARDIVSAHLGSYIPAICSKKSLKEAISAIDHAGNTVAADENTIIGMINLLFEDAIEDQASDIHIEPLKDRLRVRFRRDGVMGHHKDFPKDIAPQLITRIKVMSQADIAEKRRHQDGRILFTSRKHGLNLDMRVSFFITIHGEKVVLRLLNNKGSVLDIKEIGMAPRMLEHFIFDALEVPTGVMIVTGPTGSGKTTTLYGCVGHLNNINTSIITAEDPVEYVIEGISQCSINPKIGVTFEETLRHIVRQDPDVIVLGEIRDQFSAETAIQAALTGHKVLTTFHTEDSIGGLIRLLNMNIEAFLISSTVVCIVAQRLLRKVCPECAEPYTPTSLDLARLGITTHDLQGANFRLGRGCKNCRFTGYRGRVAIFELLVMNEMVKNAILDHKSSYDIRKISIETSGMVTLMEDGLVKGANGLISLHEIITDLPRLGKPRPLHELRRLLGVAR